VGSVYRPYRDFGVFLAYAQTKNPSVSRVIRLMYKQLARVSTKGVPRQGIRRAKQSMINKFVFSFDNSHAIARRRFHFDWHNLPHSYLNEYTDKIRSVEASSLDRLAAELLLPEKMITVVVGPADKLKKPLSKHFDLTVFKH
jgi:zinc protease